MSLDRAINILVTITLTEMMVLVGLRVRFVEVAQATADRSLLARAAVAIYGLVPTVPGALVMWCHAVQWEPLALMRIGVPLLTPELPARPDYSFHCMSTFPGC